MKAARTHLCFASPVIGKLHLQQHACEHGDWAMQVAGDLPLRSYSYSEEQDDK